MLRMEMVQVIEQVQIQAMECSVCLQLIGRVDSTEVAFKGTASRYGICVCCGQAVSPKWTMAYIRRHDAWSKRQKESV